VDPHRSGYLTLAKRRTHCQKIPFMGENKEFSANQRRAWFNGKIHRCHMCDFKVIHLDELRVRFSAHAFGFVPLLLFLNPLHMWIFLFFFPFPSEFWGDIYLYASCSIQISDTSHWQFSSFQSLSLRLYEVRT
jgi:hypothetical protein